jgi:glyoxylase-like metal-dependent hydrolase (beta-lactamase superfamily II)
MVFGAVPMNRLGFLIIATCLGLGTSPDDSVAEAIGGSAASSPGTAPPPSDRSGEEAAVSEVAATRTDSAEPPAYKREQVAHEYGTDPRFTHYPEKAVDTDDIANIVLSASDPNDKPLHYYRLAPDTYLLLGNIAEVDEYNRGWNGNAGFVVTAEGVVAVDSLGTPKLGRRMIATIRSVTDKPVKYLIITHNHPDHAYGAIAFRRLGGVTVIAHEGQIEYLGSDSMQRSVAYRRTFIPADMQGFEPVRADVLVGGERFSKYSFELGGKTFDVYNVGHHHSHGDLVVHQVKDGILWISDLAFNQRVTFMADGSSEQAIEGQNWLLRTFPNARLMVPGHGSAQTTPFPMVTKTREYMRRLRSRMAEALRDGVDLQEAVERTDFPDWRHVRLYGLNHRANVNFVYREMEQEYFR